MDYGILLKQAESLLTGRWITDLANLSALVFHEVPRLNWVGFYLFDGEKLTLGPFQGKPACTEIPLGKGVCGTAAARRETLVVSDVHEFSGHIACDVASRSEVVVPLVKNGKLLGVFDIDSPETGRFNTSDQAFFEAVAAALLAKKG